MVCPVGLVASQAPFSDATTPGATASVIRNGSMTAPRSFQTRTCVSLSSPRAAASTGMHQQRRRLAGHAARTQQRRGNPLVRRRRDQRQRCRRSGSDGRPGRRACSPHRAARAFRHQLNLARRRRRHHGIEQRQGPAIRCHHPQRLPGRQRARANAVQPRVRGIQRVIHQRQVGRLEARDRRSRSARQAGGRSRCSAAPRRAAE